MIDEKELLKWLESTKRAARVPPIVEDGKYTMVVEYVPLRDKIRGMVRDEEGTGADQKS